MSETTEVSIQYEPSFSVIFPDVYTLDSYISGIVSITILPLICIREERQNKHPISGLYDSMKGIVSEEDINSILGISQEAKEIITSDYDEYELQATMSITVDSMLVREFIEIILKDEMVTTAIELRELYKSKLSGKGYEVIS